MINFIQRAVTSTLIFIATAFIVITTAHAGGAYTSPTGTSAYSSYNFWNSYELVSFSRGSQTVINTSGDAEVIPGILLDITEPDINTFTEVLFCPPEECATDVRKYTATGSALMKGIVPVSHGPSPELGTAWIDIQMVWPDLAITLYRESVTDGGVTYYKENRKYEVILADESGSTDPLENTGKMINGYKRVVEELGTTGVYIACDTDHPDYIAEQHAEFEYLCYQEIGYGDTGFDPGLIFQSSTAASGQPISAYNGLFMDDVCLAFLPEDVGVSGLAYDLKLDADGKFRACEGQSMAFNACTDPVLLDEETGDPTGFNCNDVNGDGNHFVFRLADAVVGDRIVDAANSVCVGTDVADWLVLADYAVVEPEEAEPLTVYPCDPTQGFVRLPYIFSNTSIAFTTSEGDGAMISGLNIYSITSSEDFGVLLDAVESADKTASVWDFSAILMDGVTSISSLELGDTVTGSAGDDVLLGGNGDDYLYGYSGDDCIDGQQNNDHLWGDGHALDIGAGERGADVFVLNCKLGKDTIHDFSFADGDKIVNTCNASASVTLNDDETSYTVALKGQNHVVVHFMNVGELEDVDNVFEDQVLNDTPLSVFTACNGYPQ